MGEMAGLVVGGVALASLFDQCMNIFNYVDSGIHCSDEYQDAALMLTLLGGRLSRWERTYQNAHIENTEKEAGENAEHWLTQMRKRLEEAEKLSDRYAVDVPPAATVQISKRSKAVSSLADKLRIKLLKPRDGLSLAKRTRWALRDQDKMNALVDKLDKLISSLEKLFPALQEQRVQMARSDVAGLIQPSEMEESSEALEVLKAAAAKVDKNFDVAASTSSNTYRDIQIGDRARVNNANIYSEGWVKAGGAIGKGGGHNYDNIRISGDAKVQNGDVFGGKGMFDDSRFGNG